jgi:hypothetical protein
VASLTVEARFLDGAADIRFANGRENWLATLEMTIFAGALT